LILPDIIYANGAAINIDEYDPAMIQTHIANANHLITPDPNKNIATTTSRVDTDVPIDLLIVCHRLSSNILP
jgi:hypothetical protein